MNCNIDTTPDFARELKQLAKRYSSMKDDYRAFLDSLRKSPLMGEPLGKLSTIKGNTLIINTKQQLNNGDGLCCEANGALVGFRVETVSGNGSIVINNPYPIKPGTLIYRNLDSKYIRSVEHSKTRRKIALKMLVKASVDAITLQITDEDGISSSESLPFAAQPANNPDKALENLYNSISKTGEQFSVDSIDYKSDENRTVFFVPNSIANELRRIAIENHIAKRIKNYSPKDCKLPSGDAKYYEPTGDYHLNVANRLARQFYKEHGCEVKQDAFELLKRTDGLEVMTTKYCIRRELGYCIRKNKKMPEDWLSDKFTLHGQYQDFSIIFDCKVCVMHIYAKEKAIL
jgi:putative protease